MMRRATLFLAVLVAAAAQTATASDRLLTLDEALRARGLSRADVDLINPVTTPVFNPVSRIDEADKEVREVWTKEKVTPPVPEQRTPGQRVSYAGRPLSATVRTGSRIVKRTVEDTEPTSSEVAVVDDQKPQPSAPVPPVPFKRYIARPQP